VRHISGPDTGSQRPASLPLPGRHDPDRVQFAECAVDSVAEHGIENVPAFLLAFNWERRGLPEIIDEAISSSLAMMRCKSIS